MSEYKAPERDVSFALFDVLGYEAHCEQLGGDFALDRQTTEALITEYARLVEDEIAPLSREGDEQGAKLQDAEVLTPAGFKKAYLAYSSAGWFSLPCDPELGGQGLPTSLSKVLVEILVAANTGFSLYTSAIPGAISTLERYGTAQQRELYEQKLITGEWNATMCLTEPHCGTDLGLLRTKASPTSDGAYSVSGTKIFITGGDHDLTDNIVHLVLARIEGDPSGTKGISLFIVPKFCVSADGEIAESNGVSCGAVEKKMGVKASATCVMNFDGATGYLLGEQGRGLAAMFTFINASRISAAAQGVSHAEFGFQKSLAYARERLQMRSLTGPKNPDGPADPIIVHPDVRRMLMTQKAFAEGNRLLNYFLGMQLDIAKSASDATVRLAAEKKLELLTPIAKAFVTETGVESADLAIQCFGGHGYIREWGVEQNLRDARIATLYEGTTGIQAIDLLGRKILPDQGASLGEFLDEVTSFAAQLDIPDSPLSIFTAPLHDCVHQWKEMTRVVGLRALDNPDEVGAASVSYLMFGGYVLVAYFLARAALVAETASQEQDADSKFLAAKVEVARFYFDHILPRTQALYASVNAGSSSMMALDESAFGR